MGVVYLGQDPLTGRSVAIKTLALGLEFEGAGLDEARARFFREAELAGRLRHPDIVAIHDAGEQYGLAYIAMELLDGCDLATSAKPAALLPVGEVLAIAARVAQALAHAHREGVVHRDIKPANIMFHPPSGSVKVTDFGIANIIGPLRTKAGTVLATPAFMSPEQMAGKQIDGRSDLYSLGITMFQLLTGHLPFQGDSMQQLMYRIANEPSPDIRRLRPELPEELANVVLLAMEKRPEMRYLGGEQLAADLRQVLAHWHESLPTIDPPGQGGGELGAEQSAAQSTRSGS
jgi:serine/threonine-protein kinase